MLAWIRDIYREGYDRKLNVFALSEDTHASVKEPDRANFYTSALK